MLQESFELVSVGVDWLTCTYADRISGQWAATRAVHLLQAEKRAGNDMVPWGMAGFKGWKAGHIQCGERGDEFIVRLGGEVAAMEWSKFYKRCSNVSRIDIQVTTRSALEPRLRIRKYHQQARRFKKKNPHGPAVSLYIGDGDASTLYIGQRSSNRFGRIYDKGAQSKLDHWKGSVRAEVELKNELAGVCADALIAQAEPTNRIGSECSQFFRDRGVPLETNWRDGATSSCSQEPTDHQRRLSWFQAAGRGAAQKLIADNMGEELLRALGLRIECGPNRLVIDNTLYYNKP